MTDTAKLQSPDQQIHHPKNYFSIPMNIQRNDIDALNAELQITIAPIDYNERVDNAIKKYRKSAQIPGFRPGHIPVSLVKQRFGKSLLVEEINRMIQDNLHKYISENKIEILGAPIPTGENDEVGNWDQPGEFKFRYQLGLAPQIELNLDKNLSFEYHRVKVDEEMITRQVKDLARRYGKMSDPEMSGAEDLVVAELTELDENGSVKEGGISNKGTMSVEFIKDAETKEKLIGLKVGDVIVVDPMKLAENHEDLAKLLGVEHHVVHHLQSQFQLAVTEIKHIEPHAIDQELFDSLYGEGEVKGEDEMRARVKSDMENRFEGDSNYLFKRDFAKKITEHLNPQLPDAFLKRYIAMVNEKPVSPEMVERDYPLYSAQLRWELIETKIIRQYELRATQEEGLEHVKKVLAMRYAQYGLPMEDEMLTEFAKQTLAKKEEAKNVYDFLFEEKMIAVVKERCTIQEKSLSFDEFVARVQHA